MPGREFTQLGEEKDLKLLLFSMRERVHVDHLSRTMLTCREEKGLGRI